MVGLCTIPNPSLPLHYVQGEEWVGFIHSGIVMLSFKMFFLTITLLSFSVTSSAKDFELKYARDYIRYILDGEVSKEYFEEHCKVRQTIEYGQITYVRCKVKFSRKEIASNKKSAEQRLKDERQKEEIYDNCIFDKMPMDSNSPAIASTFRICERISENPSWWHKFWYSD